MSKYKIGVISDTHGLLRPEILGLFAQTDLIVHAGDIGRPEVLSDLNAIAPTKAVLGNVDSPYYFPKLKTAECFHAAGRRIYLLHNRSYLAVDPLEHQIELMIFGHSHTPLLEKVNGVIYFNPGSAGPRRFGKPISVGLVTVTEDSIQARHIFLKRS
ncbi:MAG: metallophosphoesterase family protein [Firmicutes bacterium]|jgi:putative phosphoesterase|nr:metallophosphoesterase family protein [Bacillota bacterium]NLL87777.1 metallophosphoesterase family protein [Bacillota bacterium]HKM17699.1 metallophosphoesterase family protein [Limnochordia bacterium]